MIVSASLFVSVSAMALYSVRLSIVFNNMGSGNQDFLVGFIMSSSVPLVFLTQMIFLLRRSSLLTFFSDWRKQLLNIGDGKGMTGLEKKIIFIYCIYFCNPVLTFGALWFSILRNKEIRDDWATVIAYGPYVSSVGYILCGSSVLVSIFCSVIDIVPSLVYYRAGLAVKVLVDRWKLTLLEMDPVKVQRIISLYLSIGSLVTRADYLFGPIIVLNHGITFFFICTLSSTILKPSLWTQSRSFSNGILLGMLIFFLARLIWPILFKSKLHGSSEQLKTIVLSFYLEASSISYKHYHSNMGPTPEIAITNKLVKKFAFFLANKTLAACPCGLYNITPSIFLTMLSLLATYTIIIMQT